MTNIAHEYFSTPELAIEKLRKTGEQFRGIQRYIIDGLAVWTCEGHVKECSPEEAVTPDWWNQEWDKCHGIPYNKDQNEY